MTQDQLQLGIALVLIAAAVPLVASIAVALIPKARPIDVDDYFVFARKLDIDSFLKTSVGYSLQVAAIFLFFNWTFQYGLRALLVPLAWGVGFVVLGWAVSKGYLDRFLQIGKDAGATITIHGFVGAKTGLGIERARLPVLALAISTIVGLGGTMMVEVDYATKYLLNAANVPPTFGAETTIHIVVLSFTVLYVLWGGYKAVVYTDRIQVPVAYFAFGVFLLGFLAFFPNLDSMTAALIVLSAAALFWLLLRNRRKVLLDDHNNLATAMWLFGGLLFLSAYSLSWLWPIHLDFNPNWSVLWPDTPVFMGFGLIGATSLLITNGLWQFIDISSLQRLQSLQLVGTGADEQRSRVSQGLTATGIEAAAGWILVIFAALALKAAGIDDASAVPNAVLAKAGIHGLWLTPLFMFTVVVFMLSTISAFVSAIAYVAFYDLRTRTSTKPESTENSLAEPRKVTLGIMVLLYLSYVALRAKIPDSIAAVLYAIYAIQASIAPSVFVAFRGKSAVSRAGVLLSITVGWLSAIVVATGERWSWISQPSWEVLPPFAALLASSLAYWLATVLQSSKR